MIDSLIPATTEIRSVVGYRAEACCGDAIQLEPCDIAENVSQMLPEKGVKFIQSRLLIAMLQRF